MSTTYIAQIVTILTLVLPALGYHVADPGSLTETLTEIAGIIAAVYVFYRPVEGRRDQHLRPAQRLSTP